jgi:ankyrin repeat protein
MGYFSIAMGDMTPLFSAAMQGKLAEVERILSASPADLETKDKNGYTPLAVASAEGHLAVVQALVRAGADKEVKAENGFTPLTVASLNGHQAVVEALVRAGAAKRRRRTSSGKPR